MSKDMSFFDQARMAKDMMKNMDPGQLKEMMKLARDNQGVIEEQIRKAVRKEIEAMNLPSREEFEQLRQLVARNT